MLEVIGERYYIDLDVMEKMVDLPPDETDGSTVRHVSLVKFETIKLMIEVILSDHEEDSDNNLGVIQSKSYSTPFKLAFNTLLRYSIIKHI
jgi:hypothetical protein